MREVRRSESALGGRCSRRALCQHMLCDLKSRVPLCTAVCMIICMIYKKCRANPWPHRVLYEYKNVSYMHQCIILSADDFWLQKNRSVLFGSSGTMGVAEGNGAPPASPSVRGMAGRVHMFSHRPLAPAAAGMAYPRPCRPASVPRCVPTLTSQPLLLARMYSLHTPASLGVRQLHRVSCCPLLSRRLPCVAWRHAAAFLPSMFHSEPMCPCTSSRMTAHCP